MSMILIYWICYLIYGNFIQQTSTIAEYKKQINRLGNNKFKKEFIYKRAQTKQFFDDSTDTLNQIHNIGVVMSEYGCWNHESTGFIFSRSLKSPNIFYILTEGDAVVKWNEHHKQFEKSRCISFHFMKNIYDFLQSAFFYYNILFVTSCQEPWRINKGQQCANAFEL